MLFHRKSTCEINELFYALNRANPRPFLLASTPMAVGKSGLGFALTQSIKKFANFTRTFFNSKSLSRPLNDLKSGFLLYNLSWYGYMESLEHIFRNSHFLRWLDLNWLLCAPLQSLFKYSCSCSNLHSSSSAVPTSAMVLAKSEMRLAAISIVL